MVVRWPSVTLRDHWSSGYLEKSRNSRSSGRVFVAGGSFDVNCVIDFLIGIFLNLC